MDKSTTPAEPDGSKSPFPDGGGSEQDFGATGIFGTEKASGSQDRPATTEDAFSALLGRAPQATPMQPQQQPGPSEKVLVEPAVHKVVFGGVAAERSPDLLDQMRMASAAREREAVAEKAPASEFGGRSASSAPEIPSSGQGSSGFTQLLRKLGNEAAPAPPAARETPPQPQQPRPVQDQGFTSLLQKLGTADAAPSRPAEASYPEPLPRQPIAKPIAEETRTFAPAPASGSLTDMFRAMPGPASGSVPGTASGTGLGGAETQVLKPVAAPAAAQPDTARPEAALPVNAPGNAPENSSGAGAFTKLFETFAATGAGPAAAPAAPAPAARVPEPQRGQPGSFTQMLAMEPQSQAPKPPPQYDSERAPGRLDYGLAPGTVGPANPSGPSAADRNLFAPAPPAAAQPTPASLQASGVGITRLISMLDQPIQAPTPARNTTPVNPPASGGPGGLTATFAALDAPGEPAPPAAKQPEWAPMQTPRTAPGATGAVASRRDFGGSLTQPAVNAPPSGAGPSEFTRIMDASKMREQSLREGPAGGASGATGSSAPPPAAAAPAPASMPMPNYQMPPAPGMGAMPRPPVYPPQPPQMSAQVPGYPMSYSPQAGAMHPPGGGAPQMPGMYPPAPPQLPAAPQLPPLKPVEPGLGKLQQYVPLLLVVIIVLLVALIVTVIFLMKR